MIHLNIGKKASNFSFGLEASYWMFSNTPLPISIDLGLDFSRVSQKFYSEFQTGLVYAGLSGGIVAEYKNDNVFYGFQCSIWGVFAYRQYPWKYESYPYPGIDFRYRRIDSQNIISPGIFAKYPFPSLFEPPP